MGVDHESFTTTHEKFLMTIMRCSFSILLSLIALLSVFSPAIEAAAARRRGKASRRGAVARRVQQVRRGRGRMVARRGRQDVDVAAADANAMLRVNCPMAVML